MQECCKCGKTENLFKQWTNTNDWELCICEDCIKKHKMYTTETCYSSDMDMTFIFVEARVYLGERPLSDDFIMLSQTLVGYVYGRPENNEDYIEDAVKRWIRNDGNDRAQLLRQAFNENFKENEEVLY